MTRLSPDPCQATPERARLFDARLGGWNRLDAPAHDAGGGVASKATPQPDAPSAGALVLVVDDDAQMRDYMRTCLASLPVRVAEAVDGQDALDQIAEGLGGDLAMVVTDLVMPRVDGRALKASLQANPRWSGVPVLLVTGESVRARDGPVLRKPFNARTLAASARALLSL